MVLHLHNKCLTLLNSLLVLLGLSVQAETILSDEDIGNKTFEASGSPYIVECNIIVPEKKKTVIKAGCVFLFKEFTGCKVSGSLLVEGTSEKPVVFSSANDLENIFDNPPAPFDWNGIEITSKATIITFCNFALKYSVFGIKSSKIEMMIKNGNFSHNGQYNLTINGDIQPVKEGIPFSYQIAQFDSATVNNSAKVEGTLSRSQNRRSYHLMLPVASGVATLSAGGAAIYYLLESLKWHDRYLIVNDDFDKYIKREEKAGNYALACSGVALTSLAVGVVSILRMSPGRNKGKPDVVFTSNISSDYVSFIIHCSIGEWAK